MMPTAVTDNVTEYSTESKVMVTVKFRNEDSDPLPAREGYTFLGWAEKADATEPQYDDGDSVEIPPVKTERTVF